MSTKRPPQPTDGHLILGQIPGYRADMLNYEKHLARTYGDVVDIRGGKGDEDEEIAFAVWDCASGEKGLHLVGRIVEDVRGPRPGTVGTHFEIIERAGVAGGDLRVDRAQAGEGA